MKAVITCSCGKATKEVEADTLANLGEAIMSQVVAMHATSPHEVHGMSVDVDHGGKVERELVLKCIRDRCDREREMRVMVPWELVGAMTLLFHTAHEGHRLEMSYDGRTWTSPKEGP